MTTLLYDYYLASIEDAKKNLQGEDLEKCLQALKNYMDNYAEMDEATHRIAKDYGDTIKKLGGE